jgi:hypothetical protein
VISKNIEKKTILITLLEKHTSTTDRAKRTSKSTSTHLADAKKEKKIFRKMA